jgi:6-pyruvoyl-tetrahydropterin synthase
MKKTVWITTSFIGYHQWPDAPARRFYLRELHRHKFNVRVAVEVIDSDREVEFHDLKDSVNLVLSEFPEKLGSQSCEHLALVIYGRLPKNLNIVEVTVDEDGECGATLTWP